MMIRKLKNIARARLNKEKKEFEKKELFLRNLIWNADGKQSKRNEAALTGDINCKKYTWVANK